MQSDSAEVAPGAASKFTDQENDHLFPGRSAAASPGRWKKSCATFVKPQTHSEAEDNMTKLKLLTACSVAAGVLMLAAPAQAQLLGGSVGGAVGGTVNGAVGGVSGSARGGARADVGVESDLMGSVDRAAKPLVVAPPAAIRERIEIGGDQAEVVDVRIRCRRRTQIRCHGIGGPSAPHRLNRNSNTRPATTINMIVRIVVLSG